MGSTQAAGVPPIPGLSCAAIERRFDPGREAQRPPGSNWPLVPGMAGGTRSAAQPPSVLVAEPQPGLSEAIAGALRQEGFEVCTAADGVAAVYGLRHHWPDVAVLDLDLPGVTGCRLMHLLKQDRSASPVPVLLVTSLSFDEALEAIRSGADDLLELPSTPAEVVRRVRRLLAHRRLLFGTPALAVPPGPHLAALPAALGMDTR